MPRSSIPMIIGIDFDNTIVNYDELIYQEAVDRNLIREPVQKNKKLIRDIIRELPDGEIEWQKIQAAVYGPGMDKAALIKDVYDFFILCKDSGVDAYIVSHKTQYANYDTTGTDLRKEALNWLSDKGFFKKDICGLTTDDVFFESTRIDKINRIRSLKCTHFIDDLEETFLESTFPPDVEKILYNTHASREFAENEKVRIFQKWKDVQRYFFDGK